MPKNPIRILTMIELDPAEEKQVQEGSPVAVEVVQMKNREEFRKSLPEAEVVTAEWQGPIWTMRRCRW